MRAPIAEGRYPRFPLTACLAMSLLGSVAITAAQDLPIYELGEVVVTGESPRIADTTGSVAVVSAEEIARSGARTLDEALDLLPGLYVRHGADGAPRIDMRGLRTRSLLLLLDGVPLNSTFDGQFDPATVSVANVAYIKVTRGASSVLYGPGGTAGVINVVTRDAGEAAEASLRLEGGASGSRYVRAAAAKRAGALGFLIAGSFDEQNAFELADDFTPTPLEDGGDRLNSDREDGSAFASLTLDASPRTQLGLAFDYRSGDHGRPPIVENRESSDFANRARFERLEQEAFSIHTALSHQIGNRLTLRPSLYLNRGEERSDGFDDATFIPQERAGAFHEDATASVLGASLQIGLASSSTGLLTLYVDGRKEEWDADGFSLVASGGGGSGGGGGGGAGGGGGGNRAVPQVVDENHGVRLLSLAAEYELSPAGPFSAVLGVGYSSQRLDGEEGEDDFTFLLGGIYRLTASTALRAAVGRKLRFPTLRDLYATDRGNPGLRPERTLDYEVALERAVAGGPGRLALALFQVDARDFIERGPESLAENLEELRFRGVEASASIRPLPYLRLAGGYTYLEAENRSPPAELTTLQNRPQHKLAVTVEYDAPRGVALRLDALYVADRYALSRSSPVRALRLADYGLLDLHLAKALRSGRLQLLGRLENLLDEDYEESFGFPQPGRRLFLGLEWRWRP